MIKSEGRKVKMEKKGVRKDLRKDGVTKYGNEERGIIAEKGKD